MDKKIYLKTGGLLYILIVVIAGGLALTVHRYAEFNLLIVLLIILAAAVPVAAVTLKILLVREKNKPFGKVYSEFRKEVFTHGYTDKYFELAGKAIDAYRNGEKIDVVYLKDFVLFTADYHNMKGEYDKALSLLVLLNESDFMSKTMRFADYGFSALMYYGCYIETYRGLNDRENAIKLIERAKPLLDSKLKNEVLTLSAYTIYYTYYMLLGNYELAQEYLNKVLSFDSEAAKSYYARYYIEAEFDLHLGKRQEALEALKKMEPMIKGETKELLGFIYQAYQERLGLNEEMQNA
ncbi:hypothetical protein [Butyrivibrio sp. AE2032]|uniref:hypothetical protein n=1 Tax=Butyrivibrio sp. AE2032 TaxID=1458463 RepID=UPI000551718E|nr:hypothetical protein [Butyrivibrio sp. AE2032]